MYKQLSKQAFIHLAKTHQRIAVYKEFPSDQLTPVNAYLALNDNTKNTALLESSLKSSPHSRYSHLCLQPYLEIKAVGNQVTLTRTNKENKITADPYAVLRQAHKQDSAYCEPGVAKCVANCVGTLSYDAVRLAENIPSQHKREAQHSDFLFRFYKITVCFDHKAASVMIACAVSISDDPAQDYDQAMSQVDSIVRRLLSYQAHSDGLVMETDNCNKKDIKISAKTNDALFKKQVEKAKQSIYQGDVFQVVLSRDFEVACHADPFSIYRHMRVHNPSPYLFYFETKEAVYAGASPEKLISLQHGIMESCPLAGTRPRCEGRENELADELLADPKENAEHMMLVDLSRNDLGRIAKVGSVHVTQLKQIEMFPNVMHLASTVQANIEEQYDAFDALRVALPAGTLSGAPKIKAMTIIDELETSRRGLYGGALCMIDSQGNLESCIAIRMAEIKEGKATVRAGAGIVADSDPQSEADETYHKAKAILESLLISEGAL